MDTGSPTFLYSPRIEQVWKIEVNLKCQFFAFQLMHDIGNYLKTGDEGAFKIFLTSS